MSTKELINEYVESKRNAWSESTRKSEASRLRKLALLINGNANALWGALHRHARYTRLTAFIRVAEFWDYYCENRGLPNAVNPYRLFQKENALLFKHAYQPKRLSVTFEEAKCLIEGIKDEGIREKALQLLSGGLRYTESLSVRDGQCVGKGGKPRRVYVGRTSNYRGSYHKFWRALKAETGLTPHMLRKLFATEVGKTPNVSRADLNLLMGWDPRSRTADIYLQPQTEEKLVAVVNRINGMEATENEAKQVSGEVQKAS